MIVQKHRVREYTIERESSTTHLKTLRVFSEDQPGTFCSEAFLHWWQQNWDERNRQARSFIKQNHTLH